MTNNSFLSGLRPQGIVPPLLPGSLLLLLEQAENVCLVLALVHTQVPEKAGIVQLLYIQTNTRIVRYSFLYLHPSRPFLNIYIFFPGVKRATARFHSPAPHHYDG